MIYPSGKTASHFYNGSVTKGRIQVQSITVVMGTNVYGRPYFH